MARSLLGLASLLVVVLSFACGGGETTPVTPQHVAEKPPTPAAARARWVFSSAERELRGKLDIGDHQTLYVGEHGRRELDKGDGQLVHAPTLAVEGLQALLRDDKGRLVFVATDGDTYVAKDPLGPLERITPARTERLESVTAGRRAILGISNGVVMRSSDDGATWRKVDYVSTKLAGAPVSVALDSKGNGLLVHLPQRVFATHDDGASWAPIPSPPHGAVSAVHDGGDRVFVLGYRNYGAFLDGDKLVATNEHPKPIYGVAEASSDEHAGRVDRHGLLRPPRLDELALVGAPRLRVLADDHVIEIAFKDKKTEVRSGLLGEALGSPTTPDAVQHAGAGSRFVAWKKDVVQLHADDGDDESKDESKPPTTTILESKDYGSSWQKEDVLRGVPKDGVDTSIAAGPRGWLYVGSMCPTRSSVDCEAPRVRPVGKKAFERVASEPFDALGFAFDEPRNKVYVLGSHDAHTVVYEGALDGAKLVRANVIDAPSNANITMTVDDDGALRVFEPQGRYVTIHWRNAKGASGTRFVPESGTLAFTGRRGLMIGAHESLETNDGGDTWTRVPSNGTTRSITCSQAGCILDDAQRIGWDLPAAQTADVVRAQDNAPAENTPLRPPPPHKTVTPVNVSCKTSGKGSAVDYVNWIDAAGAARWATSGIDYGAFSVTLTYATKDAMHRVALLPAVSPSAARTATEDRDEGIVAARYRFAPRAEEGKLNPVNVELVWWTAATAQVHRGTLPKVSPFRVSRTATFSGTARIVEGGLAFQGAGNDVIHFVHDDGTTETLTSPGFGWTEAWHSGKRWLLTDADSRAIELASSEDGGKTWTLHGWGFGLEDREHNNGSYAGEGTGNLQMINGKLVARSSSGGALYDVAWPIAGDPPVPTQVDTDNKDDRCVAPGTMIHRERNDADSPVVMIAGGKTFNVTDRVYHDTATGKVCTSVYLMDDGAHNEAYLYPDKGGWSGWYYDTSGDKSLMTPLTCQ